MRKLFVPLFLAAGLIFLTAPMVIMWARYESTMGLVQKIFYFHMPPAMLMLLSAIFCGIMSGVYIAKAEPIYDWIAYAAAELTVLYGAIAMVTGPMWARKAWGVWWQWDARLTSSLLLFLMMIAYLIARRYGGPAGRKLSAALGLFAAINVPLVYKSVDIWRTVHPQTTVVPKLDPRMRPAFWSAFLLITLVWALLLTIRVRLERARAELAALRLDAEELAEVNR